MTYHFTIPGRLPGLNEYIEAERSHRLRAAALKAESERLIMRCIRAELGRLKLSAPVTIDYHFFEPNRRRDKDNISSYARKLIQDSLVKCGVLRNDGWNEIADYHDFFGVDGKRPRIEITITEVTDGDGEGISDARAKAERRGGRGNGADSIHRGGHRKDHARV